MPGTVQELASMFRKAIDSQGNVLDMGVVKEVVAALERSPVSAKDLKDLKSTRLGKYINQVRRAIPDKSLAKRMKTLVIQWRSLAQQSPTTPNGLPSCATSSPLSTATTPSPPPGTVHTVAPAKVPSTTNSSAAPTPPNAPTPTNHPTSSQALPPPRPTSSNPAMNRKRALHRLSKFPLQHPPQQKSSLCTSSSSSSSFLPATHKTPSPTPPPLASSQTPSPAHLSSTSKPPSIHPGKLSSILATTAGETSTQSKDQTTGPPPSLQVRFPLHSVTRSLVVRIPLESVSLSRPPVVVSDDPPLRTSSGTTSRERRPTALVNTDSHLTYANGLHTSVSEAAKSSVEPGNVSLAPPPPPKHLSPSLSDGERQREKTTELLNLVVSINRDLLRKTADLTINLRSAPSQQDRLTSTTPATRTDSSDVGETPLKATQSVAGSASGGGGAFGVDGVWRKWTDPIIHEDSFAVNVLPYVYVDGLEENEEETT